MSTRLNLDLTAAMAESIGADAGLDRRALLAQIPRISLAHAAITSAPAGRWPHLAALEADRAAARAWAVERRDSGAPLALVGDPAAVDGARALAATVGGGADLGLITSPDPIEIAAVMSRRPHLVALEGAAWVEPLTGALAESASGITRVGADGPLAGPGADDARFGPLSPLALALVDRAGASSEAVLTEARALARRISAAAMYDNPAYLLAAALMACRERGRDRLVLVTPSARLDPWASWAVRAVEGLTCRVARPSGLMDEPRGLGVSLARSGDELALQRLLDGPADTVALLIWSDDPGPDLRVGAQGSATTLLREQHQRWAGELRLAGRPALQLRLPGLDPSALGAASTLLIHAAIAWAAAQDLDPIAMPAVARWRARARQAL